MTDFHLTLATDDHVVLGNRIRACREALQHVLVAAVPGTQTHVEADRSIAALDRLRAELDCDLRGITRGEGDPRRLAGKVYYGLARFVGSANAHEERWNDDFACWDLDGE